MLSQLLTRGIAQKIYLGFVLPLAVLLVAGILVPIFVWLSLDAFRAEFEARTLLNVRAVALREAAVRSEGAVKDLARYRDERFRRARADARIAYRDAVIEFQQTREGRPDDAIQRAFDSADRPFREWFRLAVNETEPPAGFPAIRERYDALSALTARKVETYRPIWRRAELFRRSAVFVVPAIAAVLSLLIGRAIALGITRPLEALTRAARALERGADPAALGLTAPRLPSDELGELHHSFVEMARAIGQREAVLVAQNEALAAIRRRIEAVLNATNDGIVLLDRTGAVSLVNARFAYFFGVEPEDLLDHTFEQIRPFLLSRFQNRERVRECLRAVLRDPESIADETFELVHPSVRTVRLFTAPVRAAVEDAPEEPGPGELLGRIVVIRDVTRESEVDRMKSEFVSTVSHELRTPLTAIQGYVDLILAGKPGPLTPTQREFLEMMQGSGHRLHALITDLLDISRIEAGKVEIRRESVDYLPLVNQTVQMLAGEASLRSLTVETRLPEGEPLAVTGDSERISQVLTNLLSNAIKYTPPGGQIHVEVEKRDGFLATCVADSGPGIPAADRERVFQKFYRADNSTTRAVGGTGLGLAIAHAIVHRLGGAIWLEDNPGGGSRFLFTLPISQTAEPEPAEPTAIPPREGMHTLYLAVGSDSGALHRIAHALHPDGVLISAAASLPDALRRVHRLRPDAVLLDPFSSGFDARELVRAIRGDLTLTRQPPLYLYTLTYDIGHAEMRDPIALTVAPESDAARLGFEATLTAALKAGRMAARTRTVVAIGPGEPTQSLRRIPALRGGVNLIQAEGVEEAERKLGALRPTLLIADIRQVPLSGLGEFLKTLHARHRDDTLSVLLIVEPGDPLLAADVQPLVKLGDPALPVEHFARAIRQHMAR